MLGGLGLLGVYAWCDSTFVVVVFLCVDDWIVCARVNSVVFSFYDFYSFIVVVIVFLCSRLYFVYFVC